MWLAQIGVDSADEVFEFFMANLNRSICIWDWFINWQKVYRNVDLLAVDLNTFNFVAGSDDTEARMLTLLRKKPSLIRVIPILIACRLKSFVLLTKFEVGDMSPESFAFAFTDEPTAGQVEAAVRFARESGVCEMLKRIKSVPDYVMGVEVGLDTNGRKNRTGTSMETIVGRLLKPVCEENGYGLLSSASPKRIKQEFGVEIRLATASRSFDFAIYTKKRLFLIETNYYTGGGTKLKSVAGEFTELHSVLNEQGHSLIWLTDGQGWLTARGPLRDAFNRMDYVLNLKMVGLGVLEGILASLA